jgi:hypothetical protein
MEDTKYLFDDTITPEGMISVSQIQTYLSCKKKWEYGYIEEITPRVERSFLMIGKLCHKGMQTAMQALWYLSGAGVTMDELRETAIASMETDYNQYMREVPLLDEEIPDMEQMWEDAKSVFTQALEEFDPLKYEVVSVVKDGAKVPALELHFYVPCAGTRGLHGFIDAILKEKETGHIWCVDYKFRKTLAPDEDEAFNIQNSVYSYACMKMDIPITGTMTWQHVNTPAAEPQVLKDGKMSRSKIKTTWSAYREACIRAGIDPADYEEEMVPKLSEIEWFRATREYRNAETITTIWNTCVVPVSMAIAESRKPGANNYRSLYPWNCKMCQFQSLCQAELRGYDANAIRLREYTKRSHAR